MNCDRVACPTCHGTGEVDASLPTGTVRTRTRRTAMDTSVTAAVLLTSETCRKHHIRILTILRRQPLGLADFQITDAYNNEHPGTSASTLRARRSELMHAGFVVDSGWRRPTRDTGRPSAIWSISDLGLRALHQLEDAKST